jgi:hypothetical protein
MYASMGLDLPTAVQSDKWAPHVAVALLSLGATDAQSEIVLRILVECMSVLAGEEVDRASATRGAWVLDKAGALSRTRKGWYALSEGGVVYARHLMGDAAPPKAPVVELRKVEEAPVVEEAPMVEEADDLFGNPPVVKEVGVPWLPPSVVGGSADPYYEDEYLLALATEQASCFGGYSPRAEVCGGCPVSGACSAMLMSRMSMVATTLAKQDADRKAQEQALEEQERARQQRAEKRRAQEEQEERSREERRQAERDSLRSILDAPSTERAPVSTSAPAPAPAPAPNVTAAPASAPAPAPVFMTAAFSGVCSGCKKGVAKGDRACFVTGKGMFHPACV